VLDAITVIYTLIAAADLAEDPPVIVKILSHLGLPSRAPPRRVDLFPNDLRSRKPLANASRRCCSL
jgi:hypothetical protein